MNYIDQMHPSFGEEECKALNDYMRSGGWVTEFKKTRDFEKMIADFTGAKFCSVVSNGTVSLTVALMACGIGMGDEVIVPDYTMVATANAAELIGAKTVFVDIDRNTLCMDFNEMVKAVTERTKAVILVSINGRFPDNIKEFIDFCKDNGIHLIEDAAQSLGSYYGNKHLGRYGEIGSFSFSAPKIISTGQGGALITDDEGLYKKIVRIRDFGRDGGGSDHYLIKGWNFKFTDIQAVIGIEQMKKISHRIKKKKTLWKLYKEGLSGISGVELVQTDISQTCPWFFDILCEDRDRLKTFLNTKKIGSREFYPALHAEPAYGYNDLSFPVAEEISMRGLWLPSAYDLTEDQVHYICESVKSFYSGERECK